MPACEIGHVTQFLCPRPRVSALDLVAEPLVLMGQTWAAARRVGAEWLQLFGLTQDIWQAYPPTARAASSRKSTWCMR